MRVGKSLDDDKASAPASEMSVDQLALSNAIATQIGLASLSQVSTFASEDGTQFRSGQPNAFRSSQAAPSHSSDYPIFDFPNTIGRISGHCAESIKLRWEVYKRVSQLPGSPGMADAACWIYPAFDRKEWAKGLNIPGIVTNPAGSFGTARAIMKARHDRGISAQVVPTDVTARESAVAAAYFTVVMSAARWPEGDLDITKPTSTGPVTHGKGNLELKRLFIEAWANHGEDIADRFTHSDYEGLKVRYAIVNAAGMAHRNQGDPPEHAADPGHPLGEPFEFDYDCHVDRWKEQVEFAKRQNLTLGKRRVMRCYDGKIVVGDRNVTVSALGGFYNELTDRQLRALQPKKVAAFLSATESTLHDPLARRVAMSACIASRQRVAANTSFAAGLPLAAVEHAIFHGISTVYPLTYDTSKVDGVAKYLTIARKLGKNTALVCDAANFDMTAPICFMPEFEAALRVKFGPGVSMLTMTTMAASLLEKNDRRGGSGSRWLQPPDLNNFHRFVPLIPSGHRLTTALGRLFATVAVVQALDAMGHFGGSTGTELMNKIHQFLSWKFVGVLGRVVLFDASDDIAVMVLEPGPGGRLLDVDLLIKMCRFLLLEASGALLGRKFMVMSEDPDEEVVSISNPCTTTYSTNHPTRPCDDALAGNLARGWAVKKKDAANTPFGPEIVKIQNAAFKEVWAADLDYIVEQEPVPKEAARTMSWDDERAAAHPESVYKGRYLPSRLSPEMYDMYYLKYYKRNWSPAIAALGRQSDAATAVAKSIAQRTRDMFLNPDFNL